MSERYSPAYELSRFLVETLRSDVQLEQMLFSLTPRYDAVQDRRVWEAGVDLTEFDPQIRSALPRVLVSGQEEADIYEQADLATNSSPVTVTLYTLGPKDAKQLVERVDARVKYVVLSTRATDARIISAELVPVGRPVMNRQPDFNDAWACVRTFRSANVGVLV